MYHSQSHISLVLSTNLTLQIVISRIKKLSPQTVTPSFLTFVEMMGSLSMSLFRRWCIIFISLSVLSTSPAANAMISSNDTPTVYQVLEEYDLPVGLLPKGVTGYELDSSTGKFTVHLNKTCSFKLDGYNLKYKTKITGVISNDALKDLSGVQVKILLLWFKIEEVTRDGDELDFSVGIASTDFPLRNFAESPQCGCGFDCVDVGRETIKETVNGLIGSI